MVIRPFCYAVNVEELKNKMKYGIICKNITSDILYSLKNIFRGDFCELF